MNCNHEFHNDCNCECNSCCQNNSCFDSDCCIIVPTGSTGATGADGAVGPADATGATGAGTQGNNGMVIITAAAGDVLTVRNHSSSSAVTLQTLAGGTQINSNASILIQRLS